MHAQPCIITKKLKSNTAGRATHGEERKLRFNELKEIRREVYKSTRLSKDRDKIFYDKCIYRKEFTLG